MSEPASKTDKNQATSILSPRNGRDSWKVLFFRAGEKMMDLEFTSSADAQMISTAWKNGAGMGEIAELQRKAGRR